MSSKRCSPSPLLQWQAPSRALALLLGLCSVLATGSFAWAAEAKDRPMNVVLILADDLGWSDLGCYGSDLHETPNIDRLAKMGVRFTDAYAAAPVCSPTRASIMTGRHPARLHLTTWFESAQDPARDRKLLPANAVANLGLEEATIAKVLQRGGYVTALVGKWHLGDAAHYPEAHGFDINIGGTCWGAPQTYFYPYSGSGTWGPEFRYIPHLEWGKPGEYLPDRLTDEALRIIDRAGDQPFFLYLAHYTPHTPLEAPKEAIAHFEKKIGDKPESRHRNATYAAMIQSLDQSVGRIMARLEERRLSDHTVVVFTSDNGGFVNEWRKRKVTDNSPLRSGKGSLYEGGIRVPLIILWPGVTPAGTVSHEPVVSCDLAPTLLAVANISPGTLPGPGDGMSLLPVLRNANAHLQREALPFHYPHYYPTTTPVSAVRAGDWKLLEYYEDGRVELYNLKDDLGEKTNLAQRLPEQAARLQAQLHAWLATVGAQLPSPNPGYKPPALKRQAAPPSEEKK